MPIQFFCPRWGSEHLDWNTFAIQVKEAGYDGIEVGIDRYVTHQQLEEIFDVAKEHHLPVIAQQHDTSESQINKHIDVFANWFEKIKIFAPLFVNSQTGKDFFSFKENEKLFAIAEDYTKQTGIAVYHETHRSKCLFAAHIAKEYLNKLPQLQITFDVSHWICVAESLLADQPEAMQVAMAHTAHIHARVGYVEGPQVTDPFAPEWQEMLNAHLAFWDTIIQQRKSSNSAITITLEFGAFPYMIHLPGTQQPVSDQWSINVQMMNLLRERYSR